MTPAQSQAISTLDANLQIIACAGAGKTEVITRRIVNILKTKPVTPGEIVAFTFTVKAAEAMKQRIAKTLKEEGFTNPQCASNMYVGTIHSYCHRLLTTYSQNFQDFKILDTVKSHLFIERYHRECGMADLELSPHPRNIKLFIECIEKMADDYQNRASWEPRLFDVFEKYRAFLHSHAYLDFPLLTFETTQQIQENQEIRNHLSTIKYLTVDEYQDVDDLQEKLISHFSTQGTNICVVGDDDQTIYQFRGSNANNMINFANKHPGVTQVKLETNFRSTKCIVDIAANVIKHNQARIPKQMNSGTTGETTAKSINFPTPEAQYSAMAEEIKTLRTISLNQIAILVRKGKFISPICAALDEACIPYTTDSPEHFFTGNYFTRFVETMRFLTDVNKARLYEIWQDLIPPEQLNESFKQLRRIARSGGDGNSIPLSAAITQFLETTSFLNQEGQDPQTRQDDYNGFIRILDDYNEIYKDYQLTARVLGMLNFLETQAAEEYKYHSFKPKDPALSSVQIMTVHKAKGLEFQAVFIPQLVEGEFPVGNQGGKKHWHVLGSHFEKNRGKYQSDIEDERKLFYVAITRAKQNLYLYYAPENRQVSRFINEITQI